MKTTLKMRSANHSSLQKAWNGSEVPIFERTLLRVELSDCIGSYIAKVTQLARIKRIMSS